MEFLSRERTDFRLNDADTSIFDSCSGLIQTRILCCSFAYIVRFSMLYSQSIMNRLNIANERQWLEWMLLVILCICRKILEWVRSWWVSVLDWQKPKMTVELEETGKPGRWSRKMESFIQLNPIMRYTPHINKIYDYDYGYTRLSINSS